MADQQYDVSNKVARLFKEKQKIRDANRQHYLKELYNPYRGSEAMYDHAVTRFHALWMYRAEYMKPTKTSIGGLLGFVVIPVIALTFAIEAHKNYKENLYRSGKVAYKNRINRHIL